MSCCHAQPLQYLHVEGTNILDETRSPVFLRGATFGCWLLWEGEGYGLPNPSEHIFRSELETRMGTNDTERFFDLVRVGYIQTSDFDHARHAGMNFVRLPFHHRYVQTNQATILDEAVAWAKTNAIYVLLDLHAAPGGQNTQWHSDSDGNAYLWENPTNQEQVLQLWATLSERYKDESVVLGYELLNEPAAPHSTNLTALYERCIATIRTADTRHIIFLDGNNYASDFAGFHPPSLGSNIVYVFHEYSVRPQLESNLVGHIAFRNQFQVPIMCDEFGGDSEGAESLFFSNNIPYAPWQYKLALASETALFYYMPNGNLWKTWLTNISESLALEETNIVQEMFAAATNSTLSPPCLQDLTNRIASTGCFDGHDLRVLSSTYPGDTNELRRVRSLCDYILFSNTCDVIAADWLSLTDLERSNTISALQTQFWIPVDNDADGLPDLWENNYAWTINSMSATSDLDGDHFTDLNEYLAETIPTDSDSFLGMTQPQMIGPFMIAGWQSSINKRYSVYMTTNLLQRFDYCVQSNIYATQPLNTVTDSTALEQSPRFYKVILEEE
jgi:hypothetical protein